MLAPHCNLAGRRASHGGADEAMTLSSSDSESESLQLLFVVDSDL
jgi:hypothetical protein